MKKEKNKFLSSPMLLATFIIFSCINLILLIVMITFGLQQIIGNLFLMLLTGVVLFILIFFLLLINKFTYIIKFDKQFIYYYKRKKLVNILDLNSVKMVFLSPKYGYVNIEGSTLEGRKVVLSFEYSKSRGEIIKRYYSKLIENLPNQYK